MVHLKPKGNLSETHVTRLPFPSRSSYPVKLYRRLGQLLRREYFKKLVMANVDSILNFDPKTEDDFYAILGCDENSTPEQINAEYKVRALLLHPDKNAGDKEAEAKFQKLQMAKETLLDHEKRSNYDKWRHCGMSVSYQQWLGVKEHVHQSMHWSTLKTKDRMLPGNSSEASGAKPADLPPAALRRASEGGANIQWGPKGTLPWNSKPPSDVVSKFRNYEI